MLSQDYQTQLEIFNRLPLSEEAKVRVLQKLQKIQDEEKKKKKDTKDVAPSTTDIEDIAVVLSKDLPSSPEKIKREESTSTAN